VDCIGNENNIRDIQILQKLTMRTIRLNSTETTLLGRYLPGFNIVLCDATYGAFSVYVPDAKAIKDVTFLFQKTDSGTNAVTVLPIVNGQTFNGSDSITLVSQYDTEIITSENNDYIRHYFNAILKTPDTSESRVVVGSDGSVLIGDSSNNTTIEDDGTVVFNGDATVWDDMRITPGGFDRPGVSDPSQVAYDVNGGGVSTYLYEFAKNNFASFTVQLPHGYREGTNISVHIHWTPRDRGVAESGNTVGWKVEYSWTNIDEAFPTMGIADLSDACDGTNHKHQMTPAVSIDGTGKKISSMLICNVKRTDAGTDDTWSGTTTGNLPLLLEVDFHYEIDTVGSRLIGTKS
jgi:hypothetical protein